MKILYIGQLDEGGTCFDRMNSLKRLDHDIIPINTTQLISKNRVIKSLQWRYKYKFLLKEFNAKIRKLASSKNYDCVWIDKGIWVTRETCISLKKDGHILIHYTPDAQITFNQSTAFFESIPIYDYLITTKSFEVAEYKVKGAKNITLVSQGFCPIRYKKAKKEDKYHVSLGFIGRSETHYLKMLKYLGQAVDPVSIWGSSWKRYSNQPFLSVHEYGLYGEKYVNALASFDIGIGLLSKYMSEQHTTRTFEIPAAGTFLLAERTPEHQSFFKEGIEAEFFSSPEELVDKAKFYLDNPALREKIAKAGRDRCWTSGYDNDSIIKGILDKIGV